MFGSIATKPMPRSRYLFRNSSILGVYCLASGHSVPKNTTTVPWVPANSAHFHCLPKQSVFSTFEIASIFLPSD